MKLPLIGLSLIVALVQTGAAADQPKKKTKKRAQQHAATSEEARKAPASQQTAASQRSTKKSDDGNRGTAQRESVRRPNEQNQIAREQTKRTDRRVSKVEAQNSAKANGIRRPVQVNNARSVRNNWQDRNRNRISYADAFRRHDRSRHDRNWWRSRYNTIILVNGGYYYQDAGYWYPAWGYDSGYNSYAYDVPIYAYNGLPPDQVVTTVQGALQQQGYYAGAVDGSVGPRTRAALSRYQSDHGLAVTAAIDEPTLATLGLV